MGWSEGQAGARDGMKRLIVLLLCAQIAGCANSAAMLSTSTATASSVTAGTTAVGAEVTAAGSGAGAIALFALAAIMISSSSENAAGTTTYRANPFDAITPTRPPPTLDSSRRVNEQDCTKPIKDWSANLKCR